MPPQERERLLRDPAPAPTTSFDASDRPQEGEKDWIPTEEIRRPPPPVVAAPEPRTDETPVVPERAPAPLAKTGDEPLYLECARVGDAYRCVPIDVVALERAVPKAVHPVAPIPTPVATGRVDRDVSESLDAVHDPRAEAPDPEAERTYGPVQRGDTVLEIAKQFFDAADINLFDAAAAIVRANPHAFHRGNPDLLMVATALDIPALDAARQRGGWASLIKQAPPTQVVESSHRTIPGTTPGDPIINVRPVPLQDPQDVAVRTDFVRPGAGPAEPNTLLAHTRDPGTTAHPRTPLSAAAQTEIQELQRQIEMIDQRLQRSGGQRLY